MLSFRPLLAILLSAVISFPATALALSVGDAMPQVIGRDTSGNLLALSQLTQKPKVLNFFWVECIPCRKEIPLLAEKEKIYPGVDFIVIHAENNPKTDANYDIADIQQFIDKLPAAPKRVVLGSARLKEDLGIKGFPFSVLLSADNRVEKILFGFNDGTLRELEGWLDGKK
jgi:thiol-disulfide isomerase/thioredoxin